MDARPGTRREAEGPGPAAEIVRRLAPIAVVSAALLVLYYRFSTLGDLLGSPITARRSALRAAAALGALAVGYALGAGRTRRAWLWCGLIVSIPIVLCLAAGIQYRGSARWLPVRGLGLIPANEWIVALWCILFAGALRRTPFHASRALAAAISMAVLCLLMGSRTYAVLILAASAVIGAGRARSGTSRLVILGLPVVAGAYVVAYGPTSERMLRFFLSFGDGSFHTRQIRALLAFSRPLPGDGGFTGVFVPHLAQDCTFALDLCASGWILTVLAYLGTLSFMGRYAGRSSVRQGRVSPGQVLMVLSIGKGSLHVLSCLALVPTAGVPFPLLSLSGSDAWIIGLILGCDAGRRSALARASTGRTNEDPLRYNVPRARDAGERSTA